MFIKKELISGIIIITAVFMAAALIPILGFMVGIFTPLAVLYFSRSSRLQGVVIFLVSIIGTMLILKAINIEGNLPFMFSWGSVGLFLSEFFKKKYSLDKAVFYSVLIFLFMGLILLLSYSLRVGEDPWALVETYIQQSVQEAVQVYSQAGLSPEQIKLISSQSSEITKTVYHLLPAIMVISAILFIWINVMAAKVVFAWRKAAFPDTGDLAHWRIPDQLVWFVIASAALILIPTESFKIAGTNLISIFLFVYLFQGLSIIHFYFEKKNLSYFLRGLFYVLIFAQHFLLLTVVGLGFFDLWVDFRKIKSEAKLSEEKGETQ